MKITGIGNALVDVLVRLGDDSILDRLHLVKGGMILIDESQQWEITSAMQGLDIRKSSGGSAGNAMLALAHLGVRPGFIGRIGRDDFGEFLKRNGEAMGLDVRFAEGTEHTGVANTFITPDSQRTFGTLLGAAALMRAEDIKPELFRGYDLLHVEGYLVQNHELIERICSVAKACGLKLSLDFGSYNIVEENNLFFHHLVKDYFDIAFANEEEAQAYTGHSDPESSLSTICKDCEIAVVKLGSKGASAMARAEGKRICVPAVKVDNVIDTTAAGDFFAGGFLFGLSQGYGLEKSLLIGALLSSEVIQVIGTCLAPETWERIRSEIKALS